MSESAGCETTVTAAATATVTATAKATNEDTAPIQAPVQEHKSDDDGPPSMRDSAPLSQMTSTGFSSADEDDDALAPFSIEHNATGHGFLDSELADLHEFFQVGLERQIESNDTFWLQLPLPISRRQTSRATSDAESTETIDAGKFVLSIRLKLQMAEETATEPKEQNSATAKDVATELCVKDTASSLSAENSAPYAIQEFSMSQKPAWFDTPFELLLTKILTGLIDASLTLVAVLEEFYIAVEDLNYPDKQVRERDFYYPVFDARHWGRSDCAKPAADATINVSYRARALYDFQALMQGELSFQENEMLQVFANLGNGWLTAKKIDGRGGSESAGSDHTGLIPENYIERLS